MPRCSAAGLGFIIVPAGFNALLEFLTGFTYRRTGFQSIMNSGLDIFFLKVSQNCERIISWARSYRTEKRENRQSRKRECLSHSSDRSLYIEDAGIL
jgi:hypothetical protein